MRARLIQALVAGLLLALMPLATAQAEERILRFVSDVDVQRNGDLLVTETIRVQAEGDEIRRGILRNFPTTYRDERGASVVVGFDVESVTRDGRTEPYSLENLAAGFKRIRIGDADVFLSYGKHRYTIRYSMSRMGRTFADHDELFWNVTGNYWVFPIDTAVASIALPPGAVIKDLVGYTGPVGSMEQAVEIT